MLFSLLVFLVADTVPTHLPDPEAMMQAMRKTLPGPDVKIEIVDASRFPVPDGDMQFDWKGLTPPATGQSIARWRGVIRRDQDHTFSIWAVVRITAPCRRIVTTQTIRPDEPITASQVSEESYQGFPADNCAAAISDVLGKVATRTVLANTPVVPAMLAAPASILKGEQAIAEYQGDAIHLSLPVIAERNGRVGEIIPVRNLASRKVMQARVTGERRVSINDSSVSINKDAQ
jgi:flagella basal body P-ring formation protein FlgA